MKALRTPFGRMWGWPIVLGVATAVGLVTALVGDGVWDAVSWFGLGLPVAFSAWYWLLRPRAARTASRTPSPSGRGRG